MLNRIELINITNDFKEHLEYKEMYIDYLNKMLSIIENKNYKSDKRFVTYGRRDFLLEEYNDLLNNGKYLEAFYDLEDYINARTWIPLSTLLDKENPLNIIEKDNEYNKEGIISLEEKEILINMIKKFINVLEKISE